MANSEKFDIYQHVTDTILAQLEHGILPWHQPWHTLRAQNTFTHKPYRGVNPWLLINDTYTDTRWAGFGQIRDHGGIVRKGEHGKTIVYYKWIIKRDKDTDEVIERFPMLRYLRVFNVEQTNLVELGKVPSFEEFSNARKHATREEAEAVFAGMPNPPKFRYDAMLEATYNVATDEVTMPPMGSFNTIEGYYGTLWHELTHSTRHPSRLNRNRTNAMADRAFEELVAEMGAALISAEIGYGVELTESAAYIQSWLQELRNDKKFIIHASYAAQKATDYILKRTFEKKEETKETDEEESGDEE